MLKGYTKIELTDVKTGEKKTVEKHNLITNALSEVFNPLFGLNSTNPTKSSSRPDYLQYFGGIMLFDSEITENANQVLPDSDNAMVGCGTPDASVATGDNKYMGTYNGVESGYDAENKTMKLVYDYSTSQANGTIQSICLTHADAGRGFYNSNIRYTPIEALAHKTNSISISSYLTQSSEIVYGDAQYLITFDIDNEKIYTVKFVDSSTIKILTRRFLTKHLSLLSSAYSLIDEQTITLSNNLLSYKSYNYDPTDNALYIISSTYEYINPNTSFQVCKISFPNFTVTQSNLTNATGSTLSNTKANANYQSYNRILAYNGYLYFCPYDYGSSPSTHYFRIQISNYANVVDYGALGYYYVPIIGINGKVVWSKTYLRYSFPENFLISDETQTFSSALSIYNESNVEQFSLTPVMNHPLLVFAGDSNSSGIRGFHFIKGYLATINNLPEPITKTTAQTMKITYTLQEVENE